MRCFTTYVNSYNKYMVDVWGSGREGKDKLVTERHAELIQARGRNRVRKAQSKAAKVQSSTGHTEDFPALAAEVSSMSIETN